MFKFISEAPKMLSNQKTNKANKEKENFIISWEKHKRKNIKKKNR